MPRASRSATIAFAFAAVLGVTLASSWTALSGPFLFDDFPNLQHLSTLPNELDWRSLAHYASLFESEPGRPLSMLSFVINDAGWPSDPSSFKYTNLMLHLLVGTLLFGFTRTLARAHSTAPTAEFLALLAASAWLLHPMQLSTSMLVVQRMTQLSALFAIAGLWGYTALALRARGGPGAACAIVVLGIGTVLSVLCKENGALTPLLAVVLNLTLIRSKLRLLPKSARTVLQVGTWLPVAALLVAIAARWSQLTGYGNRDFTMGERLLTQTRAICDYLLHIIVPNLRGSGIYHDDFAVSRSLFQPATTLPALVFIAAVVMAACVRGNRHPVLAFAVGWFLGGHLLESTVFPLELYFEHRNYLPMFGVLYWMAWCVLVTKTRWRTIALALSLTWLAYAAMLTSIQAKIWGSASALSTVWVVEHPDSPRATQQRADHLFRSGDLLGAAHLLLDAYRRGLRGGDFPLQALIVACSLHDEALAAAVQPHLSGLSTDKFASASLGAIRNLRLKTQSGACPSVVAGADWLYLTESLLRNDGYRNGKPGAYLHVERAYYFTARGDLASTMRELELAWSKRPSPDLALLGAATLSSAGLNEQASEWAERGLEATPGGLSGILSTDRATLIALQRLLDERRAKVDGR